MDGEILSSYHAFTLATNSDKLSEAAYDLTGYLGISHSLWAEACAMLGNQAAAVCVVLIDQAMHQEDNPVRKPNGHFRSMLRKAERGSSTCTIRLRDPQAGQGAV